MEVHVRSESVKVLRQRGKEYELGRPLPVFGDHDRVEGTVVLDVGFSPSPGRLTISVSTIFFISGRSAPRKCLSDADGR